MIAYLKGIVRQKNEKSIALDVRDVGYLISLPSPALAEIEEGQTVELFIHTSVREDDISLFGFLSLETLRFFKQLIAIPGIGPKSALEVMTIPLETLQGAIVNEDLATLTGIPGIGKKTAERIIVDMKGKIKDSELLKRDYKGLKREVDEDAISALLNLGYQRPHIIKVFQQIPDGMEKPEEIIKYFLQHA